MLSEIEFLLGGGGGRTCKFPKHGCRENGGVIRDALVEVARWVFFDYKVGGPGEENTTVLHSKSTTATMLNRPWAAWLSECILERID